MCECCSKKIINRRQFVAAGSAALGAVSLAGIMTSATVIHGADSGEADFKSPFLRLCDLACHELSKEVSPFVATDRANADTKTHHMPYFEDAHAVRALAVAYDISGKKEYLDTCRRWCDQMVTCQKEMLPKGHHPVPGLYPLNVYPKSDDRDRWDISGCSLIARALLATSLRCTDKKDEKRYLDSVETYARVVISSRIGKNGGLIEELWENGWFDEWWCSTAEFGAMSLQLYEITGNKEYLKVGMGALRWMIGRDFRDAEKITFEIRPSGVIFYDFQLHVAGLKYLPPDSEERKAAMTQISEALKWMAANQIGPSGKPAAGYIEDGRTDMAGLPMLMYAFAHLLPEHRGLVASADQELSYIGSLLFDKGDPPVSQLKVWEVMTWGMLSYAEKLSPGSLFRSSKPSLSQ